MPFSMFYPLALCALLCVGCAPQMPPYEQRINTALERFDEIMRKPTRLGKTKFETLLQEFNRYEAGGIVYTWRGHYNGFNFLHAHPTSAQQGFWKTPIRVRQRYDKRVSELVTHVKYHPNDEIRIRIISTRQGNLSYIFTKLYEAEQEIDKEKTQMVFLCGQKEVFCDHESGLCIALGGVWGRKHYLLDTYAVMLLDEYLYPVFKIALSGGKPISLTRMVYQNNVLHHEIAYQIPHFEPREDCTFQDLFDLIIKRGKPIQTLTPIIDTEIRHLPTWIFGNGGYRYKEKTPVFSPDTKKIPSK